MRVTTAIAALSLTLACGISAALSEPLSAKSDLKSLAAPGAAVGTLASAPRHSLSAGARQLKADAGKASLKSATAGSVAAPALTEATRSGLVNRSASVDIAATRAKSRQRQFFAAAGQAGHSSFGLRSFTGGAAPGAPAGVKQPELVQKLR